MLPSLLPLSLLPSLPLEQPVVVLALALTSFLVAPILIEQARLPGIVGIILAGTALGPNGLGVLTHGEAIILLGNAGLVYLLFTVGLELDLRRFLRAPGNAALFGLVSFGLPFVVGTGVCMWLLGFDIWTALLLAAVFATHTLLAYPVVNKLDLTQNDAVTAVFGGILFTDTLGLIVLALVLGVVEDGLSVWLVGEVAIGVLVLFGGLWLVVPPVARWFFQVTSQESYFEFLFVAALLFGAAGIADTLGLAAILGAFVAGIALNRQVSRGGTLMNRIEFFGNAFFIPFFLFHVGMLVDPAVVLDGIETVWIAAVILGVMFATKLLSAAGFVALKGYNRNELGVLVGLSTGQAAAALAIVILGFEAGLFDAAVINAVVVMILVSAIVSPWLTERYGRRLATEGETSIAHRGPYDPSILLAVAKTTDMERRLLELAFVLKDSPASTPVHLLTVLGPNATDDDIARADRDLRGAAEQGAAAEVPMEVQTRINHNVASGINRAAVETRADLVLLGWEGDHSLGARFFGDVIDQVRDGTTDPVLVSGLERPINTIQRILFVLPPAVGHHEGFAESTYLVKRLARNLGAGLEAVVVETHGRNPDYDRLVGEVEPQVGATVTTVDGWSGLDEYFTTTAPSDLVVPLTVREGAVGWAPQIRRLPRRITEIPPEAFVVVTPRQGTSGYPARFFRIG